MKQPKFKMGQIVATPGALKALEEAGADASGLLRRHASGDWGDVCKDDAKANDRALEDGSRLLSSYHAGGTKIWIITEAIGGSGNRASTCILLPEDY